MRRFHLETKELPLVCEIIGLELYPQRERLTDVKIGARKEMVGPHPKEIALKPMVFCMLIFTATTTVFSGPNDSNWIQLFRPGDTTLSDWIPKIEGQNLGVNLYNTFRYAVSNDSSHTPMLEVIDTTPLSSIYGYGHLFYKTPFSDYLLRAQFHFPQKSDLDHGGYTIQNNGLMLHSQDPHTMGVNQAYPNCFENQLLGYWSNGCCNGPPNVRSSNICANGTTINYQGKWYSDNTGNHCTNAKFHDLSYDSSTIAGNGLNSSNATWPGRNIWEYSLSRVLDSTSMTFWVRSRPDTAWDSVMGFTGPHSGQTSSNTNLNGAAPISSGYIAIQLEGTSTEFAKIELLNLVGCMDKNDTAYRAYFVKNDPTQCSGVSGIVRSEKRSLEIFSLEGNRIVSTSEIIRVDAYDLNGVRAASFRGAGRTYLDLSALKPGLYNLRVETRQGIAQAVYPKL